jgi:iron(III) transport system substrate-binding protein
MKFNLVILLIIVAQPLALAKATRLSVYTSRKEHLVKDIFMQYEKETGVKVSYKTGKAGALIQNILSEGKSTPADLFMTVDAGNLGQAASKGILESINSSKLTATIPKNLRDSKNRWFALSMRARTIVVNSDKVSKNEVIDYETLADKKWRGRLCLRTSKKVYNQSLVAMLIDQHGRKKAKGIVAGWVKNNVEIFSNDTAALKAVAAGRCDATIVNTYYFGRLQKQNPKLPLRLTWPNQKSSGVHVNVSGAGVVKSSKHKKEAIAFLEWLASKEAQKSFAQVNMEYPVLKGLPNDPLVDSWGSFKANSSFQLSLAGPLQKDAIKLMDEVGYK